VTHFGKCATYKSLWVAHFLPVRHPLQHSGALHIKCSSSAYVHPLHGNPYSSQHIYHLAFSPMIVLIDVSLSHYFCLPPPPYFSLFHPKCQLSCLPSSIV